jgi:UDP-3-O-[3-hydroxymyristoyl] N-acetylglucosamine deacetylase|tara:strand:+ start:940 stop:1860 length:921 start_codon:yes stop_codon:yes gene_type:complete
MSALNQKTIKESIQFDGVGLHTGQLVNMKINPAEPNTGIIFKRTDLKNNNYIIPGIFNVSNANLCTTISNEFGAKVSTIEHLMAALFGMGIDNTLIEIDSQEVPILDGSAKIFVEKIKSAGINTSNIPIKIIKIEKKISFKDGVKSVSIEPNKISLDIDFEIKYKNLLIGTQRNIVNVYEEDLTEIYNSRTFCLYEDVEKLKKMNLAKGGSLENALVVKDDKILNEGGLRNKKEFVNHKILDCIGDLYLSGYKIIGKVICSQGGHKLTNQLLREVFQDKENFSIVEIKEKNIPHSLINRKYLRSIA